MSGYKEGGHQTLQEFKDQERESSDATLLAIKENTEELRANTREIKRFNRTSTYLALAMIVLTLINIWLVIF